MTETTSPRAVVMPAGRGVRLRKDERRAQLLVAATDVFAVSYTHLTLPTTPYV